MLSEFCNKLSDIAQLKLGIQLAKAALPIWQQYFAKNPDEIDKLNELISDKNKIKNGSNRIEIQFPERALVAIEKSLKKAAAENTNPMAVMKKDPLLLPFLATSMQPLTNTNWDITFTYSIRLVYTSIWNILTWLLLRKITNDNETHIYVAINQAADALMTEKIVTKNEIENILLGYKDEIRIAGEDVEWNSPDMNDTDAGKQENNNLNEIYLQLIGKKNPSDAPIKVQTEEILRQMREEGKSFWDKWEEYYSGTSKRYMFDKEKNTYMRTEMDVIVASFYNEYTMTEEQMLEFISGVSLFSLRENGFVI